MKFNLKTFRYLVVILAFISLLASNVCLAEDENEANSAQSYKEAEEEFANGDYKAAAKSFQAAELYAKNFTGKATALKRAAEAYRKADLQYKEFTCLKKLLDNYPDQVNFDSTVQREYEIGNSFYKGYRESPYSWFPWIEDKDQSLEVYNTILKQAPFAAFVPEMLIRMGDIYQKDGKYQDAIKAYNRVLKEHPTSKVTFLACLNLANIHLQLAKSGDGDGSNVQAAREALKSFIEKYPDNKAIPWVKNSLDESYNIEAARMMTLAKFYKNNNNEKAAKRYIREVLVNYPGSNSVPEAEALLDDMEMPLYPNKHTPPKEDKTKYTIKTLKSEPPQEILVNPQNSDGKWIVPIEDLGFEKQKLNQDELMKKL